MIVVMTAVMIIFCCCLTYGLDPSWTIFGLLSHGFPEGPALCQNHLRGTLDFGYYPYYESFVVDFSHDSNLALLKRPCLLLCCGLYIFLVPSLGLLTLVLAV